MSETVMGNSRSRGWMWISSPLYLASRLSSPQDTSCFSDWHFFVPSSRHDCDNASCLPVYTSDFCASGIKSGIVCKNHIVPLAIPTIWFWSCPPRIHGNQNVGREEMQPSGWKRFLTRGPICQLLWFVHACFPLSLPLFLLYSINPDHKCNADLHPFLILPLCSSWAPLKSFTRPELAQTSKEGRMTWRSSKEIKSKSSASLTIQRGSGWEGQEAPVGINYANLRELILICVIRVIYSDQKIWVHSPFGVFEMSLAHNSWPLKTYQYIR